MKALLFIEGGISKGARKGNRHCGLGAMRINPAFQRDLIETECIAFQAQSLPASKNFDLRYLRM
jgi:hypothetical protein